MSYIEYYSLCLWKWLYVLRRMSGSWYCFGRSSPQSTSNLRKRSLLRSIFLFGLTATGFGHRVHTIKSMNPKERKLETNEPKHSTFRKLCYVFILWRQQKPFYFVSFPVACCLSCCAPIRRIIESIRRAANMAKYRIAKSLVRWRWMSTLSTLRMNQRTAVVGYAMFMLQHIFSHLIKVSRLPKDGKWNVMLQTTSISDGRFNSEAATTNWLRRANNTRGKGDQQLLWIIRDASKWILGANESSEKCSFHRFVCHYCWM